MKEWEETMRDFVPEDVITFEIDKWSTDVYSSIYFMIITKIFK